MLKRQVKRKFPKYECMHFLHTQINSLDRIFISGFCFNYYFFRNERIKPFRHQLNPHEWLTRKIKKCRADASSTFFKCTEYEQPWWFATPASKSGSLVKRGFGRRDLSYRILRAVYSRGKKTKLISKNTITRTYIKFLVYDYYCFYFYSWYKNLK